MHNTRALFLSTLSSLLAAQSDVATPAVAPVAPVPADAFRVALHDDPTEPGPALWASGDHYKVRLDRDVEFYPLLGSQAPRSLPLRWRTASVRVGDTVLPAAANPARAHTAWRCEIDHGGVVEAYDVRPEGVEQTFTLHARPAATGDLVVCGSVDSALRAEPVRAATQALTFRDTQGRAVITYGAAQAIDAAGRVQPMTTAYDGREIELRLDAAWLAGASFPVVVDPLLASGDVVSHLTDGVIGGISIASSDGDPRRLLVAYHRAFSAGDRDVFAYTCEAGFANPSRVFSRIGSFDDHDPSAAFHAASNRWVVAFERKWATGRAVHTYLHARDSLVENSGAPNSVPLVANEDAGNPVVGGTRRSSTCPHVLLAYESDLGGSVPDVVTLRLEVATNQFAGSPAPVGNGAATVLSMRGNPAITQVGAFLDFGWLVAWEQGALATGNLIAASRYDSQGVKLGSATLIPGSDTMHAVEPRVAGVSDEFMLTFGQRARSTGSQVSSLDARRITWPVGGQPELSTVRNLQLGGGSSATRFDNGTLAYDWHAGSQWVATYLSTSTVNGTTTTRGAVRRLGATGGTIEVALLSTSLGQGTGIAGTYDWQGDRFAVAYGTNQAEPTRNTLRAFTFVYPSGAAAVEYGSSCSSASVRCTPPLAGNENFAVYASGLNVAQPAGVLLLGGNAVQISLASLGMTGCNLLVSTSGLVHLPVAGSGGILSVNLPLPDAPVVRGTFRCQFAYLDANANALGVRTTHGLQVTVE